MLYIWKWLEIRSEKVSMVKRIIIAIACVILTTVGCMSNQEELKDSFVMNNNEFGDAGELIKSNENQKSDIFKEGNLVDQINELIKSDRMGDKKEVYWDGTSATLIEDELDQQGIQDGQIIESLDMFLADELIVFQYPHNYIQTDADDSNPDKCHLLKGDSDIYVSRVDYLNEKALLDSDENYIETDTLVLREDCTSQYKQHNIYLGTKELNGVNKVGYVLIFENDNELAPRNYKVEVYGLGSLSYIRKLALTVMNSFSVIWYSLK